MQLPTIHSNGTSRIRLVNALEEVSNKLNDAYESMREAAPNGRDYYPQGPEALQQATREHLDRMRRLDEIKAEVDALAYAIDRA